MPRTVLPPNGCGEEQLAEVLREHVDGAAIRLHFQVDANVALDGGEEHALRRVGHGLAQLAGPRGARLHARERFDPGDLRGSGSTVIVARRTPSRLAAPDGEVAVRRDVRDRLLEVRVHVELGDLVLEVLVLEDGDLDPLS
jgi:hypothetical protein